jgi:hypothetical protein
MDRDGGSLWVGLSENRLNYEIRTQAAQRVTRAASAFTLAEVLAALLFMAIVIPVAVQGMRDGRPRRGTGGTQTRGGAGGGTRF